MMIDTSVAGLIGPDPVKWVNRLMDVNEKSQFTPSQRAIIADAFIVLLERLARDETSKPDMGTKDD